MVVSILYDKKLNSNLSISEVYYIAYSLLVISKNLCSELDYQKGLIQFSFYIRSAIKICNQDLQSTHLSLAPERRGAGEAMLGKEFQFNLSVNEVSARMLYYFK